MILINNNILLQCVEHFEQNLTVILHLRTFFSISYDVRISCMLETDIYQILLNVC